MAKAKSTIRELKERHKSAMRGSELQIKKSNEHLKSSRAKISESKDEIADYAKLVSKTKNQVVRAKNA